MSTVSIQPDKNNTLKIVIAFASIYIIWGTTYLAIRLAVETIPPFFMAGTRFIIAGLMTFLVLRARGVAIPKRLHWQSAAIIGAFMIVGGNGLVTWSEQQVPSGIAALVVATVPIWITLFNWLIYRGGRPNKQIVIGLVLGFIGIGLLIGPGQLFGTATFDSLSMFILLLAPILWSFGSLYSRRAKLPDNIFMSTSMEMLAGGLLLLIAGLLTGEAADLNIAEISRQSIIAMLYLTVFGSIIALTAYVWLLKTVHPSRASTYTYVNPIIAIILGWLILSEPLTSLMILAMAIIILAVVLITTSREKQNVSREELSTSPLGNPSKSSVTAD
jgi:drug/metabolite transporter (DMT)-like permease